MDSSILMAALGHNDENQESLQQDLNMKTEPSCIEVTVGAGLTVEDRMHILEVQVDELEKRNRALVAENQRLKKQCQKKAAAKKQNCKKCLNTWEAVVNSSNQSEAVFAGSKKLRTIIPKPSVDDVPDQPAAPVPPKPVAIQPANMQAVFGIPTITFRSIPQVNVPYREFQTFETTSPPTPPQQPKEVLNVGRQKSRKRNEFVPLNLKKLDVQSHATISKQKPNILRRSN